jgi:hypothetical protein
MKKNIPLFFLLLFSYPIFSQDITGNAATVTNGVYTIGDQTIYGKKNFLDKMSVKGLAAGGIANGAGGLGSIEIPSVGASHAAYIEFIKSGAFGAYFGLDVDNKFKVGGWSMGANAYEILHAGNFNSFAPTLNGAGATGNWNITSASTASLSGILSSVDQPVQSATITSMLGQDVNVGLYRYNAAAVKTFLGIPSTGETLQSVTDRGKQTSTGQEIQFVSGDNTTYTYVGGAPAYARIGTYSNSGNNKLIINEGGGNVGIGTINPIHKLEINGSMGVAGIDLSNTMNVTATEAIRMIQNDAYISGYNSVHSIRTGYLQFVSGNDVRLAAENGNALKFFTAGTERVAILDNGNVGVGTATPTEKLSVNGNIRSKKIIVSASPWPDYVFDTSYQLAPLQQVEKYIQQNKHLPDVPSAAVVAKDGVDLGDNQAVLLKKIEELTLYIIEQNKKLEEQGERIKKLETGKK